MFALTASCFRESLETTDRKTADRKLRDFRNSNAKIDHRAGKITLGAFSDKSAATLPQLSRSSLKAKDRILSDQRRDDRKGESMRLLQSSHRIAIDDCRNKWSGLDARITTPGFNFFGRCSISLFAIASRAS